MWSWVTPRAPSCLGLRLPTVTRLHADVACHVGGPRPPALQPRPLPRRHRHAPQLRGPLRVQRVACHQRLASLTRQSIPTCVQVRTACFVPSLSISIIPWWVGDTTHPCRDSLPRPLPAAPPTPTSSSFSPPTSLPSTLVAPRGGGALARPARLLWRPALPGARLGGEGALPPSGSGARVAAARIWPNGGVTAVVTVAGSRNMVVGGVQRDSVVS